MSDDIDLIIRPFSRYDMQNDRVLFFQNLDVLKTDFLDSCNRTCSLLIDTFSYLIPRPDIELSAAYFEQITLDIDKILVTSKKIELLSVYIDAYGGLRVL
jgi:hypothetical protein